MVNVAEPPDCTNHCKSCQHGEIITSAISKRSVSDTDLCAFLSFTCCRCESVVDFSGRTALHVAASCGRLHLVKWLVCNRNADIDVKDKESGYTALHRSIFYGQIHVAVELVKLGASTTILDKESLTAFEHSMKDGLKPSSGHGELFYWGSNNNSLFGSLQARDVPDLLDFHKHFPEESVKKICIEQFHIVILTNSGNIYSCGHGREGRLGLGNEGSYVVPRLVKISTAQKEEPVYCVDVEISRDHSIFLFSDKSVYSCGLNQYMVLGHVPPPDRLLTPKPIKNLSSKSIVGICAKRYHSLAWNTKTVYAWGLNAGQFGQKAGENVNHAILAPKPMHLGSQEVNILTVGASDGATVLVTDRGTIYVFHEYQCKKIASKQVNVTKVSVIGGNLDQKLLENTKHKDSIEVKVAVLLNSGDILLWQESDQQLCRCIYSINRPIIARHIYLNRNELLLVSEFGEGFKGNIRPRKKRKTNPNEKTPKSNEKDALNRILEKDDFVLVTLEKIPKIYRAFFIQSDVKGKDYCILQTHPYKYLESTYQNGPAIRFDMKKILDITSSDDGVGDMTFNLKNGTCSAHRYILLSRCPNFGNKIKYVGPFIQLPDIDCYVFQQFLTFVYTGDCDFAQIKYLEDSYVKNKLDLENDERINNKHKTKEHGLGPIESLRRIATEFECTALIDILKKHTFIKNHNNAEEHIVFNRAEFQEIYDITLKCADGDLKAHRCILSARMEYFENMLSNRWSGNDVTEVNLPFPKKTVELLLDFLYTDSLPPMDIDIDNLLKLLILADQFFVAKLKNLCETFLSEKLSFKHTVEVLSFAHMYNAHKLKRCCINFITLNMQAFLDMGYLNGLPREILEEVSSAYFKEKSLSYRVITPYSNAVSDEELMDIANKYPVLTVISENRLNIRNEQKKKTRSHRISFSKKEKISLETKTIDENDIFVTNAIVNNVVAATPNTELSKRVNAINKAVNLMKSESIPINYVKLNANDSSSSLENSFIDFNDFPQLGSSVGNGDNCMAKNSLPKHESKHKMVRMSQKQRKKLNSESDEGQSKTVSETKKSPWKTNFDFGSPISSPEAIFTMTDIISNEKKQKENLVKITNKLLHFTQKEDKAIEELGKFYNVEETFDEIISIQRVDTGAVASPFWVPKTKEIHFWS